MDKNTVLIALDPQIKAIQSLEADKGQINAKVEEKVSAKRKELEAKMESDINAFRASVLSKDDAQKLAHVEAELLTLAPVKAVWVALTFRGRKGKGEGLSVSYPVLDEAKREVIYTLGRDTASEKHVRISYEMHKNYGEVCKTLIAQGANDGSARSRGYNGRQALNLIK